MLCEASSVIKAIESVWQQSGKPSEFSIKILEAGEKGILWFTKHPAIISMSYDPKKQTEKEIQTLTGKEEIDLSNNHASKKKRPTRTNELPIRNASPEIKKNHRELRPQPNTSIPQQNKQQSPQSKQSEQKPTDVFIANTWTDEQVTDISLWMQETFVILKSETKLTTSIDKKTLRIAIDKYPIPDAIENKTLYISLGNLFMQALKKKHKKKFQGFNIIITLTDASYNGNQKSSNVE